MGDTSIKFEVVPGKNQKSEYVMACGKHTVRGWCKPRPSPRTRVRLLSVAAGSAAQAHRGLSHVPAAPGVPAALHITLRPSQPARRCGGLCPGLELLTWLGRGPSCQHGLPSAGSVGGDRARCSSPCPGLEVASHRDCETV